MTVSNMPELIVEFGFDSSASSNYWHLGDPVRGKLGTAAFGPTDIWTDVTSDVVSVQVQAGSSSRIAAPLVTFEAGTATIVLKNLQRQYDPLNTASPYYSGAGSVVVSPPAIPNAGETDGTGQAFDATVSSLASARTNAAAGLAAGSGLANNATVTGTTTPSQPTGMLFGSSGFTAAAAAGTLSLLNPAMGRAYEFTSTTSYSGTTYAKHIPAALAQFITFKGTDSVWSNPTSNPTLFAIERDNARAVLQGLSTRKGHASSYHHEPIGDMDGPTWAACNINFKANVIDYVNTLRTNPIWCMPCMNGFSTNAVQDQYFTPALCNVIDGINWDCYGYDGTGDQLLRTHDYAKSKGLPWSAGELGFSVNATGSDSQELGVMQHLTSLISGWPASERPIFVLWFNAGKNLLTGLNLSASYWNNMCTVQSVQP